MASFSNHIPAIVAASDQYQVAKTQALSLPIDDLMRLRDEIQSEINKRASEEAKRLREEEEIKKREEERIESLYDAWVPKHFERSDRKGEERVERHQKGPKYGSATESDSEAYSGAGFEYPVEEVNTSDEGSDAAEEKRRMERYLEGKLRRRFEFELANPKIFARTMEEGEPRIENKPLVRIYPRVAPEEDTSASDEDFPDVAKDDDEESSDEERSSSGRSDTSPASSGSSCSERYEEDEYWGYDDEEDY